jgi:3-phenylpropionate/cinnamic acid dioxygenase small subunit
MQGHGGESIQELLDRYEIEQVMYDFARCCDDLDFERLASLFHDECRWDYGEGAGPVVEGRANVEKFVREAFSDSIVAKGAGGVKVRIRKTSHHISQVAVNFDGPNHAYAESYVFTWHEMADGDPGLVWGRWHDQLSRSEDGWRISDRRMILSAVDNYYGIGHSAFADNFRPFHRESPFQ